ncbi:hypothetical protein Pmar_PMAR015928 [Perkinsus marinus ATCC 50983]|uniref:Uncharacterized protein n=1 Tax=Perkinsus marinus (strain ATCC 50983 / TXsc) TaxID=423536 RepID=C5L443_PERM5|nr:hypothetical protein Pmar_PMAR015928 [Perkinsus marinus ATCC 50983]EER08509.1 hypothetical protein Pmar_PMAR015928 [Perkinsus marinus ATCC 50983]|eukprot:XP_002776693.1 hypothetical protein Pmar_PMAR015928 [Perkinsus marinus ATCC 50983]
MSPADHHNEGSQDPVPSAPPEQPQQQQGGTAGVDASTQSRCPLLPLSNAPQQMEMIDPPRGPYYNTAVEQAFTNSPWSDGLCDCFSDQSSCLLMVLVPLWPVLMHQILTRAQPRDEPYPLGLPSPAAVSWVYAVAVIAGLLDIPGLNFAGWVISVYLMYDAARTVVRFYNIQDPERSTPVWLVVKSLFCQCCLLGQVARHVNRATGFAQSQVLIHHHLPQPEVNREPRDLERAE